MKKLLAIGLLGLICGKAYADFTPQSIFTDKIAYNCVSINMEKLVKANSIIAPKDHKRFHKELADLSLTKENILTLINGSYNTSGVVITSIADIGIIEILKMQKNTLIRQVHTVITPCGFLWCDNIAQDSLLTLVYSIIGGTISWGYNNITATKISAFTALASCGFILKALHQVRIREFEINQIDRLINKIEEIERAEITISA